MLFRPNPGSGVPIYLQLMEQVRHAVETGALRTGEQLPGIRKVAEELVINPNTVAKAYRELEHEGIVDLRQGAGAFIAGNGSDKSQHDRMRKAVPIIETAIQKLTGMGLNEEEIRRLFESTLTRTRSQ